MRATPRVPARAWLWGGRRAPCQRQSQRRPRPSPAPCGPEGDAALEIPQSRRRRKGAIGSGRCGGGAREGEAPGAALDGEDDDAGLHRAARHGTARWEWAQPSKGRGHGAGGGGVGRWWRLARRSALRLGGGGGGESDTQSRDRERLSFGGPSGAGWAVGGRASASGPLDEDRREAEYITGYESMFAPECR